MITTSILLSILFLIGSCITMTIAILINRLAFNELEKKLEEKYLFFFKQLNSLFPNQRSQPLNNFLNLTCLICIIIYGTSGIFYISEETFTTLSYITSTLTLVCVALAAHIIFYIIANLTLSVTIKLFSLPATLYLIVFFPIVWPILLLENKLSPNHKSKKPEISSEKLKKRLLELLAESEIQEVLDPRDKKLLKAIANFGTLVTREIMVPRGDIVCLEEISTVYEALEVFSKEGYSRIPVYKDTVDQITSVLLYKSVMEFIFKSINNINIIKTTIIKSLVTDIIYAPENKKIQDLFQEIRANKIHAAIVVNEYGCTEGLVTIEDILEELVGSEIQDEYDLDEETGYVQTQDKDWIVDAKMSVVDAERRLGIQIPHSPEYETIAGFISWQMGFIPGPGTILYKDTFNIKILSSNKRQIHKVKISPINNKPLL